MLQREIILLLAWGPAILLQFAHPLVAHGVADHSAFRAERWGRARRLHRTLEAMLQLSFGTKREALAAAARINGIHDHVHGRLSHAAGIFPKGTPYSAHDPALLAWVHATLLETNLRVYELFVAPLRVEDKDRYCVEASSIERLFGIPEGRLPRSVSELQQYMNGMYASGEISVTDVARTLSRALLYPQVSAPFRARDQVHAPDDLWAAAADDPGRLWLPVESSARGHASTAGGVRPHVAALDAAYSPLLASGARRGSCGERVRLSAPHASGWRLATVVSQKRSWTERSIVTMTCMRGNQKEGGCSVKVEVTTGILAQLRGHMSEELKLRN